MQKNYLYLPTGTGHTYVPGNGCTNKEGNPVFLNMVSPSIGDDQPGTQISYIRPRPVGIPEGVLVKIDRLKGKECLLSVDADEAIDIMRQRGRTLEEIKNHEKKFGIAIIAEDDLNKLVKETSKAEQRRKFALKDKKSPKEEG